MSAEDVTNQKLALRRKVLAGRTEGHRCGHSHSQLLIDFAWEARAKRVACYISFGDEPSTNVFLKHCQLDDRIELFVPRVIGDDLEWVPFSADQIMHPLGMNEPVGESQTLDQVDLMVVPAIAADKSGNRLGRGKGFYDRALKSVTAKKIVALVHDDELVSSIPTESHDVAIDVVCTCSQLVEI
ncbi:MAG: hypothetical protein RLZZ56_158 [Actinomycetota bacterium]|jgi:5-formyltetrahydrofolate cyclo-ligase